MEEGLKSRIILILAIMCAIFFIGTFKSCIDVGRYRKAKDTETTKRFEIEERMAKYVQEKTMAEQKFKTAEKELEEAKDTLEQTKKDLTQAQLVNDSLKEELAKMAKLKEKLEDDLKEALISGKKSKK
jgi:septal ring factor EnvC (AmiA/AmiB activator)